MILALLACVAGRPTPTEPVEPYPLAPFLAAEAEAAALVPDPARGGPLPRPDASPLPPFLGVDRATARYVGPDACAACHPAAAATWAASPHARALDTLQAAKAAANPDCFRCHVTGFGHPGGYAGARTPALAGVSCEACHGPGSAHAAAPLDPAGTRYGALPHSAAACVACHTHDTAPDFLFSRAWGAITHGRAP